MQERPPRQLSGCCELRAFVGTAPTTGRPVRVARYFIGGQWATARALAPQVAGVEPGTAAGLNRAVKWGWLERSPAAKALTTPLRTATVTVPTLEQLDNLHRTARRRPGAGDGHPPGRPHRHPVTRSVLRDRRALTSYLSAVSFRCARVACCRSMFRFSTAIIRACMVHTTGG